MTKTKLSWGRNICDTLGCGRFDRKWQNYIPTCNPVFNVLVRRWGKASEFRKDIQCWENLSDCATKESRMTC